MARAISKTDKSNQQLMAKVLADIKEQIGSKKIIDLKTLVAPISLHPFIVKELSNDGFLLVVVANSNLANDLAKQLEYFFEKAKISIFPSWETLPHERLSPKPDTVTNRLKTLDQLNSNQIKILITTVRALISPILVKSKVIPKMKIEVNDKYSREYLIKQLLKFGFVRTDLVEHRGEFAVRGGIIDIFPADCTVPIRIDFFDDVVEKIDYFEVANQRTISTDLKQIEIYPVRELMIEDGQYFEGVEAFAKKLIKKCYSLIDFLPKKSVISQIDTPRLNARARELIETDAEFAQAKWGNLAWGETRDDTPAEQQFGYFQLSDLIIDATKENIDLFELNEFAQKENDFSLKNYEKAPSYSGDIGKFFTEIEATDLEIEVHSNNSGNAKRLRELLDESESNIAAKVKVYESDLLHGFINRDLGIWLVTQSELFGQSESDQALARVPSRRKKKIDPITLSNGDFIVHEQHGIGKFVELTVRDFGRYKREYLVVEYAAPKRGLPADRIYVPTDSLDQLSKYVGADQPPLNRIGGSDWQNTKRKARKAVREIAADLIRLYAARINSPGFAFSPDNDWQKELEDSFSFVETVDQLSTIQEVKADMEKAIPMDRIICGDVGYGKTEIAVRAAFKAVQDGKQVAVLVPTTLLVQQHIQTFTNRFTSFPIRVAGLSRFNSDSKNLEILKQLEIGLIDVVIGTHRLLSKDVKFKDLGLLIVDEEQRFGVEHKEELKKARTNVDVLAMSATPIPRTLEMAVTGIREMSHITTPPEDRHPVLTFVGEHDDAQIKAAIHRELLRDGQIFYVHNRVESIDAVAERLKKLVPNVRIAVAHGQLPERILEQVVVGFWNKEFDLLLCTTIVESGIDIPNANTLIVDNADKFGLAQLHQLRGRVGRSRERAYAYFFYPPDQPLSELALDRLKTIATNTDLGAGMQVALKDLEIRGAGNLLGGEQSGHIAQVGFDLYMKMVSEAVSDFKQSYNKGFGARRKHADGEVFNSTDEDFDSNFECRLELPVNANIPQEYIDSQRLRLDIYRRIAATRSDSELLLIQDELRDRFGELPLNLQLLFSISRIKNQARSIGIKEILWGNGKVRISPVKLTNEELDKLSRLYSNSVYKIVTQTLIINYKSSNFMEQDLNSATSDAELLEWISSLISFITTLQPHTNTKPNSSGVN